MLLLDGFLKVKLKKFIEEYGMEDLFVDKGDERYYSGFNDFRYNILVKYLEKLNVRLNKYVKVLENEEFFYN